MDAAPIEYVARRVDEHDLESHGLAPRERDAVGRDDHARDRRAVPRRTSDSSLARGEQQRRGGRARSAIQQSREAPVMRRTPRWYVM